MREPDAKKRKPRARAKDEAISGAAAHGHAKGARRVYGASDALLTLRTPAGASPTLPAETARLIACIAQGRAGGLFPPVARACPEGVVKQTRVLAGERDARRLTAVLATPDFAPLVELIEAMGAWCARFGADHRGVFAPGLVALDNADLFGPLVGDAFVRCAARGQAARADVLKAQRGFQAFFRRFAARLRRDIDDGVFADASIALPIAHLWANPAETHNGRQQVLRLRPRTGPEFAYKPRPADGERIFLAETPQDGVASVFAWINALPSESGAIRLPTLRMWRSRGRDGQAYSWQEWVHRPKAWGTIRRSPRLRLEASRLSPAQAARYWHRAGSLAMACYAFGITDLGEGNVLAGVRQHAPQPQPYPVDVEAFFCDLQRLYGTGLLEGADSRGFHHVGFESRPRWCRAEGPLAAFFESRAGALHLHEVTTPWARDSTRSVVADTQGNAGYAAYLLPMLRGMFDAWTRIALHKTALVEHLARATRGRRVRVLVKFTAAYARAMDARLLGTRADADRADAVPFSAEEIAQMDRLDVPYFYCAAAGGPLSWLAGPSGARAMHAGAQHYENAEMRPSRRIAEGGNMDFIDLGSAIKDVVAYIHPDLEAGRYGPAGDAATPRDPLARRHGVELIVRDPDRGQASFDWPEAGRRATFVWNRTDIELKLEPRRPVPDALDRGLRRQLLRIQRVDAPLRAQWALGGFRDKRIGNDLDRLTHAAGAWLRQVVARHGWPGERLVGKRAAEFAARLVQHMDAPAFQRRCLRLMTRAAEQGDVPRRQVAYLADALRVQAGRPQLYGTKFRKHRGVLVPYAIERPAEVDRRREAMGLPSLASYQKRLRRLHAEARP